MWTVYSIKRIESKEAPTFVTIKGPIALTKYHSSLASALVKFGHRAFYWEQSGAFETRCEAREIKDKMLYAWTLNPDHVVEAPWEVEELRGYKYKPRIIHPCTLKVIEDFMTAATKLRKKNNEYQDEYRTTHNIETLPGPSRKTDEQKQISKIKRDMRKKNNKVLIRANKISGINKKDKEQEEADDETNIIEPIVETTSLNDGGEDLRILLESGGHGPWDE